MGYYSEAALVLTKKGKEYFDKKLADKAVSAKTRKELENLLKYADEYHTDNSGAVAWLWKSVKWYTCCQEYFPGIGFIDKVMGELDAGDYFFVRVGEEYDDNDIQGDWWDNPFGATLCRSVVLDC